VNIISLTGNVPTEVMKKHSETMRFENLFNSYIDWVSDANGKLQGLNEDKINMFRPVLDKLSRGMYESTKDLYGSAKELSPDSLEDDLDDSLEIVARTFYFNRYFDLDSIGNDLKSEKISGFEGAGLLADAFEGFKSLNGEDRQEIQNLADNVSTGIYEATKCLYDSDKSNKDEYRDTLENVANIFGSEMIKEGE